MPRNRNTRSSSPKKPVSSDSFDEAQKRKTLENVKEIFGGHIEETVIIKVLDEFNWKGNLNI